MTFVQCASEFNAEVKVKRDDQTVDGKSIMQIMMLAATAGTVLEIQTSGEQADEALESLVALVNRGFDEE